MFKKTAVIIFFFVILSASVSLAADYVIGEGDVLKISVWGAQETD